jgi:hypothetical protein
MKIHSVVVTGIALILASALAMNQPAAAQNGDGSKPILFPAGQFSLTGQGSFAVCLNPTSFAEEPCSTSGALVVPITAVLNGVSTYDRSSNGCTAVTEVDSNLPVDASPPMVTADENVVTTVLKYYTTSGTGDFSFTAYTGGKCNGAAFDSAGATQVSSGTSHVVVSEGGSRVDIIFTKLTNPPNSIGDFSVSATNLRQTRP